MNTVEGIGLSCVIDFWLPYISFFDKYHIIEIMLYSFLAPI